MTYSLYSFYFIFEDKDDVVILSINCIYIKYIRKVLMYNEIFLIRFVL